MVNLFKKGMNYISTGDILSARETFDIILLKEPNSSLAYAGKGKCEEIDNNFELSATYYKKSIELDPTNSTFYFNLANVLVKKSMNLNVEDYYYEALEYYLKCLDLKNNDFMCYTNIGVCYICLKDYEKAITYLKKSVSINSVYAANYYYISTCYNNLLNFKKSIKYGNSALNLDQENSTYLNHLGSCYLKDTFNTDNIVKAEALFKKSIKNDPLNSSSYSSLSYICFLNGSVDNALIYSEKAIELDTNNFSAYIHLANALSSIGKIDDAINALIKSIEINSNAFNSYYLLSTLNFAFTDKMITFLESSLNSSFIQSSDKVYISQTLWYHFDKIKNTESAIKFLNTSNSLELDNLLKKNQAFSLTKETKLFNKIKTEYNSKLKIKLNPNNSKFNPIFILGLPRSGTSLIEQIISSHSSVFGAGERGTLQYIADQNNFPNSFINFDNKKLNVLRNKYLNDISFHLKGNVKFITDKLPHNFLYIGFIKQLFPDAKIIHVNRNKMDVCFSIYSKLFLANLPWSYNWRDLLNYYSLYNDLMQFWDKTFPKQIFNCNYDVLVNKPKSSIVSILDYCDLPHESSCFNPHLNNRAVFTASSLQVRNKIYSKPGKWSLYKAFLND